MSILRLIAVVFLALNALFWGLFPHSSHCALAKTFGVVKCPPHAFRARCGDGAVAALAALDFLRRGLPPVVDCNAAIAV
jgi:hypothetical protein